MLSVPCISVPVTIVPWPGKTKTRSIGKYAGASGLRGGSCANADRMCVRNSSKPARVVLETGSSGASCAIVPRSERRMASQLRASSSGETRSDFVTATIVSRTLR